MEAFGLAKPYFRRHLKADAVPTVFDQTRLSQPPAPRCKAVERRATDYLSDELSSCDDSDSDIIDYTNDSSYVCDELNDDDSDPETKIAALHYNENSGRDILTDPSGAERISQRFSRGEKEWTVVPVKQNAGYGYISVLLTNVMDCLEKWPSFSTAEQASVRRHHETLSSKYGPKPRKEEARKKQYSRFAAK
ncbi:hypothetical protein HPB49_003159 [Dermacentor silvarum]|uniref:Uncharacterized protein n=1 Tax=Dermacentor silvarum TaxID=543639 RepID=A0ACB8DT46_DERSI|nr:hypothetical protein HPB49_003159 [Dermacentor silvarum]